MQKVPPVEDCSKRLFHRTVLLGWQAQGGGQYQAWLESLDQKNWNLKPTSGNGKKNVYGQRRLNRDRMPSNHQR